MTALTQNISTGLNDALHGFNDFIEALPRACAAAAEYRRLSGMSEDQLSTRGLTRDAIPGAVFNRFFR